MPTLTSQEIKNKLSSSFEGDLEFDTKTLTDHSRDASLFEVTPMLVAYPKNASDVSRLVRFVNENKSIDETLSLTGRSGGTCMSGGSLNTSIIVDFSRHMGKIISVNTEKGIVEPGCFYRDFEKETLKVDRILPSYTASKEICAIGGMVGNNSGGEKTIKYGKTERYVREQKVVFSDGNLYTVKPLAQEELNAKMSQGDFEGSLYKNLYTLINNNYETIRKAKPTVSKNSAGYYLWNVWNKETGLFDLNKLIVGSQGTLGITTEVTLGLVPVQKHTNVLAVFMPGIERLGDIVNDVLPFGPDSLESYDDASMKLAVKFFFDFFKQMGFWNALKLGLRFIPEAWMMLTGGVPKLILLVECSDTSEQAATVKLQAIEKIIHERYGYKTHIGTSDADEAKYWKIRRESFNLLRKHVKGKRTAPFIDDIIVKPPYLPEFLPKIQALLEEEKLVYTIAGHAGDGNFHIIPLMDLNNLFSADIILDLSDKVYALVKEYGGSITAEHNDGIIRTPYLPLMYGDEVVHLFQKTKDIFDPQNIFNPGKKVGGTKDNIRNSIIKKN